MTANPFQNLRVEFHILQSFPVTCLNRDDVGAPKSAMIGGVQRARVSSQSWKRAVRMAMAEHGAKLAVRSKYIAHSIQSECITLGATVEQGLACGEAIADHLSKIDTDKKEDKQGDKSDDAAKKPIKTSTLLFFTEREAKAFAEHAHDNGFDAKKLKEKETYKVAKNACNLALDGVDIALFGRMVADSVSLKIEAAAAFAHAISTHRATNEVEFFTAVDDDPMRLSDDAGSAHMGSLEFNAATYYRYINLDLGQLYANLDGERMEGAVENFIKALYLAVPAARQATMAGQTAWDYAHILVRRGQPLQLSFETPVNPNYNGGFLAPSIEELNKQLACRKQVAGSLFGEEEAIEVQGHADNPATLTSIDDAIARITAHIAKHTPTA